MNAASPDVAGDARGERGAIRVVPANEATWDELQTVLTGAAHRCQCQRVRLGDHDWWHMPQEARASILAAETQCGDPRAERTIGVVAYLGDEPVGWCAVDRRGVYGRLRGSPVPWNGRAEDPDDPDVWAIACVIVRPGFRHEGLTYPLVAGAVEHARAQGARVIEGDPMLTGGAKLTWDELHVGPVGPFVAAGFEEVSRPTKRRVVMRLAL
mgnify:FL=1